MNTEEYQPRLIPEEQPENQEVAMIQAIADRFDVEWDAEAKADAQASMIEFREALAERLRNIIDYHFSSLASMFYRIDLDERIVDEIFTTLPQQEIPYALADQVIERFRHIMETRRRYREAREHEISGDLATEQESEADNSDII